MAMGSARLNYVLMGDAISAPHDVWAVCGGEHKEATFGMASPFFAASPMAGWLYRKEITISHPDVGTADLNDFPLYVKIDGDADMAAALSNGHDVRFTTADGSALLDYERESWSGGDGTPLTATFWVKVPTISYSQNTTIYVTTATRTPPTARTRRMSGATVTPAFGTCKSRVRAQPATTRTRPATGTTAATSTASRAAPPDCSATPSSSSSLPAHYITVMRDSNLSRELTMSGWIEMTGTNGWAPLFEKPYTSYSDPYEAMGYGYVPVSWSPASIRASTPSPTRCSST